MWSRGTTSAPTRPVKSAIPNYDGVFAGGARQHDRRHNCSRQNIISGNSEFGIEIDQDGFGNMVAGNWIGTDKTGTAALPNQVGVAINTSSGDTIGGTAAGAGNLISGNTGSAIVVAATDGGAIEGNLIGTDFRGTLAVPNGTGAELGGVVLEEGTSDVTVGGTTAAARNVISGNDGSGITITSADLEVSVSPGPFSGWSSSGLLGTD